jgi:hypothetical protein
MPVVRTLEWYERDPGDEFVGEIELKGVPVSELRELFRVAATDEDQDMTLMYPVTEHERRFLEDRLGIKLDLQGFDYFVGCRKAQKGPV